MIDAQDNLIGTDVSRAHLNWFNINKNNTNLGLDQLLEALIEPDVRGETLEDADEVITTPHIFEASVSSARPLTGRELMEKLYREGKIINLPARQPLTADEQAELERIAQVFAGGKPLSEIVIEERESR